jgi:Sugar transferases involved in lipopolysaccharide synthesis
MDGLKKQGGHVNKGQKEKPVSNILPYDTVKRVMDVVLSLLGLLISFPIIAVTMIAIRLETRGSVLYKQERVGKNGRLFIIYKLRSMFIDAEKNGEQWAKVDDPRVTKVGKFIRKTRIDELPQFVNVLIGDMSMVGPRPERPYFVREFSRQIPDFTHRLVVKPGLSGLAQINGGYELTPVQKFRMDMFYIEKRCLLLDIKIILKTIRVLITGDGAR